MKEKATQALHATPHPAPQAYFDCNATTPVLAAASQAALFAMESLYGNPSSTHLVGLQAKNILEGTRILASRAVGSDASEIVFTSGATEAIQTAIFSVLQFIKIKKPQGKNKLLYGATEHKAVPMALEYWVKMLDLPLEIVELPVDQNGQLKLEVFKNELVDAALVCTMAVNNEVGVIQDLASIEKILLETQSKALWLVDCVQALGKLDLNLARSRIDYAPFSGHKLYAPKGIGFFYVKKDAPFFPLIVGGGQEKGFRSGTENLPGVAALGAVLKELLNKKVPTEFQPPALLVKYRDQLVAELKQVFPKILFNTPFDFSVPTTINFSVPGFKSGELLDVFDSAGIRISAGSACSAKSVKPSHVLDAMGFPEWRSASALRLSFGPCTSKQEIQLGCQLIQEAAAALKNNCLLDSPGISANAGDLKDGISQFVAGHANSWVIVNRQSRSCIIVDPTEPVAERIENFIRCQNLEVLAILDSHSHADHESVRPTLQTSLADKMSGSRPDAVGRAENSFAALGWPTKNICRVQLDGALEIPAIQIRSSSEGDLVLACLETPGHTPDSVSYLLGVAKSGKLLKNDVHFVFSGDLVLSGGLGRTNFSISSPAALFYSLQKLSSCVSTHSVLCPAHDYDNSYATNFATEVRRNPLMSLVLDRAVPLAPEVFIERKIQVDRDLLDLESSMDEVICGVVSCGKELQEESIVVSAEELKDSLSKSGSDILVVDVRESPEHLLSKNWQALGFPVSPINIPLSRFVNFIAELSKSEYSGKKILFICRSGGRSLLAAQSLRRLGFTSASSLRGGIALL